MFHKFNHKAMISTLILMIIAIFAEPASAQSTEINVLLESGGFSMLEKISQNFTAETGTKVNLIEVPYAEIYSKFVAEMAAEGSSYDVVIADAVWLSAFDPFAVPITDLFTGDVVSDLFPAQVGDAKSGDDYKFMPVWANAEVLFYQKSLFEDPKEQADFKAKYGYDLKVPSTWQEYIDVAKFFTRDTDGDGTIDLYGTDVKGVYPEEWEAMVFQAGADGVVFDSAGNLIIDNQAHIDALDFYRNLHCEYDVTPQNTNEIDWNLSQQMFQDGKLAMELFWGHGYRQIPANAVVAGNVGVAPMIGGAGGIGAVPGPWYSLIPTTSKNADTAKAFIKYAYDNNSLCVENSSLGLAARISAFEQYSTVAGFEHFNALIATLNGPQTMGRPKVNNWQEITDDVLTPLVQQALQCDGTSSADLLSEAKTMIEDMQ